MHGALAILAGAWLSLARVSLGVLGVAVALHVGKLCAEARAWHWIVFHAHDPSRVQFRTTLAAFVSSIGINAVLPARVGEALRVVVMRREVPGSSALTIAATIVLETAIEVAFGAAMIGTVLLAGGSLGSNGSAPALPGIAAHPLVLGTLACVALTAIVLGLAYRRRARALFARMAAGFSIVRSPRAFVAQVLSWKLVAWALRLGSVYAFLLAFHVPAAPWTALVVVAAQNAAASVPLLPGNAGTQQATIGIALAGSASAAALLGFGVGMQAATMIADLVLGAAALMLVANRRDVSSALATLRIGRRARPAGAGA
jgi:glycosyltransferase 2 family protein